MRIGQGYDVHTLMLKQEYEEKFPDRKDQDFTLGGVVIEHDKVLVGHSDADVLVHAIMDALIGAMGLGDIGRHFPDSDEKYKGISSLMLLSHVVDLLKTHEYRIVNIDATVIAEKPKLKDYIPEMEAKLSGILGIKPNAINVKATTTEKLGFAGREEGIAAQAICLITQ